MIYHRLGSLHKVPASLDSSEAGKAGIFLHVGPVPHLKYRRYLGCTARDNGKHTLILKVV